MTKSGSEDKAGRVLEMYSRLKNGEAIYRSKESKHYGVAERTIQRDLETIQSFLQSTGGIDSEVQQEIIYDRRSGSYILERRLKNKPGNERRISANERIRAVVDIVQIIE